MKLIRIDYHTGSISVVGPFESDETAGAFLLSCGFDHSPCSGEWDSTNYANARIINPTAPDAIRETLINKRF